MPKKGDAANADLREEVLFAEKLFSYCLQKFGLIYDEFKQSSLFTEDIGDAVVMLQLHIRHFVRDIFVRCTGKIVGLIDPNQGFLALQQLLNCRYHQYMDKYSIHTLMLGYLALITELIIFLDSTGIPVPFAWFTKIWALVFDRRLKQKFTEEGGWEALESEASKVCAECPRKEDLLKELSLLEHPYADVSPLVETSFKEVDPFFMCFAIGGGFDIPRRPGLTDAALEKMAREMPSLKTTGKA